MKFSNISFSYPRRPHVPVLRDLSLRVPPKATVALVGPSGCGKSTLLNLLMRSYDADTGTVVSIINLILYSLSWWLQQAAVQCGRVRHHQHYRFLLLSKTRLRSSVLRLIRTTNRHFRLLFTIYFFPILVFNSLHSGRYGVNARA